MRQVMLIVVGLTMLSFSGCQQYSEGLVKSVNRTDETVAISALRNISTAQQSYSVSHDGDYGTFSQLVEGGYLDSRYSSSKPLKQYALAMNVNSKSYSCTADPDTGLQGRHFYVDSETGVIRANDAKQASASDPPMQ